MERIATDTYSFKDLREGGFAYVDKTAILLPLADGSIGKQFFMARPRRFGKSLTVSTLKCLFEGKRELFKGLAIEQKWDWSKKWPVIHLDMGSCQAANLREFRIFLFSLLKYEAERLGVDYCESELPSVTFRALIEAVVKTSADGKCVILIDEYDKPLLAHLGKSGVGEIRDELKPFYGVVKYAEGLQRFAFITGVSKFSKVSIFSDLNNLNDLTMDARAATLFGYTHDEVKANFPGLLKALGTKRGWNDEETFAELVKWYDGYKFHHEAEPVFNPVSVGKCLSQSEINAFWFETGTPSFLIRLMEDDPVEMDGIEVPQTQFSVYEPDKPNLLSLLYQTGYLTIKSARQDGGVRLYKLAAPNFEVSTAFSESLSIDFARLNGRDHSSLLQQMMDALRGDDVNDMLDALSCFFANMPANITLKNEKYYQSLFYAVFVLIGARTQAECWTNRGRVDAMVETPCGIYVFEFKLHDTAAAALEQIKTKGYAEKYRRAGKKLTLIGAAFDATERNLSDRAIEVES